MCLAIPGKIIKIDGRKALVEYPGQTREAMIGIEDLCVGDYVQVQMGIAMQKLDPENAKVAIEAWTTKLN